MKVAVIGLGSMGKRRIRLIREMSLCYSIIGIDRRKDRRIETEELYKIHTFSSIAQVEEEIDCAFICTAPLSHAAIVKECLERNCHVFTELNLVDDGYEENMNLARKNKRIWFLSSTFLYREEIRYIKSRICSGKRWNYIYHVGQYLPDWHPWEDYKDFFIGDKRTNGCREILANELPWLTAVFGNVVDANVVSDKMTELDIGYDDNFMIQLLHENGNKGMLAVDVVSSVAVRKLEVYAEGKYISWNGTPDSIYEFDIEEKKLVPVLLTEEAEHSEGYSPFIVENAYRKEIQEFFDVVINGKKPLYDFRQERKILTLIDDLGA